MIENTAAPPSHEDLDRWMKNPVVQFWFIAILLVAVSLALFDFGLSIRTFDRFRGDAAEYFRIAASFKSWGDALTYVGDRSPGFPFFVFGEIRLHEWAFGSLNLSQPDAFLRDVAWHLFTFHMIASLFFASAIRKATRPFLETPYDRALLVLLVYPGLVFNTTVLLTDTFCADILMIAFSLLLYFRRFPAALFAGVLLGFCTWVRPSFQVPTLISILVWTALSLKMLGKRLVIPLLVIAGFAAVIVPTGLHVRSVYGEFAVQNPDFVKKSLSSSWNLGSRAPRIYWSGFAPAPEYLAQINDPYLAQNWAPVCPALGDSATEWMGTLIGCFATHPVAGIVFLFKKSVALFDHYQIQPYATDLSPRWLRLLSRPLGALAFVGWLCSFWLLTACFRKSALVHDPLVFITLFTAAYGLFQCIPHVEPRYGFGALPGAFLALGWAIQKVRKNLTRKSVQVTVSCVLILAALAFLIQTSAWDRIDPYLPQIEAKNSQH